MTKIIANNYFQNCKKIYFYEINSIESVREQIPVNKVFLGKSEEFNHVQTKKKVFNIYKNAQIPIKNMK